MPESPTLLHLLFSPALWCPTKDDSQLLQKEKKSLTPNVKPKALFKLDEATMMHKIQTKIWMSLLGLGEVMSCIYKLNGLPITRDKS